MIRGEAFEEKGDIDRAITDFTAAVNLNPKLAIARFVRGRAYLRRKNESPKNLDGAISDLKMAREGEDFRSSLVGNGIYFRTLKVLIVDESKGDKTDQKNQDTDLRSLATDELATAYLKRGSSSILAAVQATIPREEKTKQPTKELRPDLVKRGIRDLDEVIALRPGDGLAYYVRGLAYKDLDQCGLARSDFEASLKIGDSERDGAEKALLDLKNTCSAARTR